MYLSVKFLFMLSAALSAAAVPSHFVRGHRDVAARVAIPEPAPIVAPVIEHRKKAVAPNRRRRDLAQRCLPRSSSSGTTPSSTPGGTPTPMPEYIQIDSSNNSSNNTPEDIPPSETTPSSSPPGETTPTSTPTPPADTSTSTSPTSTPTPTPTPVDTSSITTGLTNLVIGALTGDGTYYATGLGACGITNNDNQYVAAVSHLLFDTYPGATAGDPNHNPICNKQVTVHYQNASVNVTLVDRCDACDYGSLDFSPIAFQQLAPLSVGRLLGITWSL